MSNNLRDREGGVPNSWAGAAERELREGFRATPYSFSEKKFLRTLCPQFS
jgi:hypothetical protein